MVDWRPVFPAPTQSNKEYAPINKAFTPLLLDRDVREAAPWGCTSRNDSEQEKFIPTVANNANMINFFIFYLIYFKL